MQIKYIYVCTYIPIINLQQLVVAKYVTLVRTPSSQTIGGANFFETSVQVPTFLKNYLQHTVQRGILA